VFQSPLPFSESAKRIGDVLKAMAGEDALVAGVLDRMKIDGITDELSAELFSRMIKEAVPLPYLAGPDCASTIQTVVQGPKNVVNRELTIVGQHCAWAPYFESTFGSQRGAITGRELSAEGLLGKGY
jgi:hypothetical protein